MDLRFTLLDRPRCSSLGKIFGWWKEAVTNCFGCRGGSRSSILVVLGGRHSGSNDRTCNGCTTSCDTGYHSNLWLLGRTEGVCCPLRQLTLHLSTTRVAGGAYLCDSCTRTMIILQWPLQDQGAEVEHDVHLLHVSALINLYLTAKLEACVAHNRQGCVSS